MILIGELAALATAACWSVGSLLFAYVTEQVGAFALNQFRITLAALILTVLLLVTGLARTVPALGDPAMGWLVLSGLVGLVIGDSGYFGSLARLGPRVTTLLSALTPPITAVLAWLFLDEKLGRFGMAGMALTMAGVVWVILDRPATAMPAGHRLQGILLGILSAICQAVGLILARRGMGEDLDPLVAVAIRMVAAALVIWAVAVVLRRLAAPARILRDPGVRLAALGATLLGPLLGVWLSLVAVRHAGTAVAATLMSTVPILILPLVVLVRKEPVGGRAVLGAVLAVAGVALLFVRRG